jgi:hypothetical protein
VVYRGDPNQIHTQPSIDEEEEIQDVSEDEDWIPPDHVGEDESVVEEWESDAEEVEESSEKELDVDSMDVDVEDDIIHARFINTLRQNDVEEPTDKFTSFPDPTDLKPGDLFNGKSMIDYEHIAGRGCMVFRGYNGHRISAQEMYGCKTVQCLISKETHWQPEAGDLEFEHGSRYYLSGLTDFMPSRDNNRPSFWPHRHGLQFANADVHDFMVWLQSSKQLLRLM